MTNSKDLPNSKIIDTIDFPSKIVTILADESIAHALELLSENKIRSLPIIKSTGEQNNLEGLQIEMVDFSDITYYFVECYIKKGCTLEKFFETKVGEIASMYSIENFFLNSK